MVKAVVGANWGDEGKGKITDMLGKRIRYHRALSGRCERRPYDRERLWQICAAYIAVRSVLYGPYDQHNRKWRRTGYSGSDQGDSVYRGQRSSDSEDTGVRQSTDGDVISQKF